MTKLRSVKPKSILQFCAGWVLVSVLLFVQSSASGAGVTIITHGLNSNVDDWVIAMADRMAHTGRLPGTTSTCYEIYFVSTNSSYALAWKRLSGAAPTNTDSGEIFIKLDWRQLANNSYSTFQVASMALPALLQTNFIPEMGGHAIAELPLHMVGHSRGGSLICELSRLLGTNGIWVDHLTTLDPHPLNNDGFSDFLYTVVDAPARTYENVLFHDNYYQRLDSFAFGEPVAGSCVRQITSLNGGYSGLGGAHSDVHLWYHGTVDTNTPLTDTAATITSSERQTWWNAFESAGLRAGFVYSLLGNGDRLSTNQPAGQGTSRIRDGYNQKWDLGAGNSVNNRTALPANNGSWPSLITLRLGGSNLVAFGQSNSISLSYQLAATNLSNAVLGFYLDNDANPYNGNEQLIRQLTLPATGSNQVAFVNATLEWNAQNVAPGEHLVFARISRAGNARYFYAPEKVTVLSSFQPPLVVINRLGAANIRVDAFGVPGQRLVFQGSTDFSHWQALSTNWFTSNLVSFSESAGISARFYRAFVR
ncbi:MAG: hypothetical protein JWM16_6079 [Verrucomicrobiales bacterium]|nr:hypothetical protein [Verrucomicrobiales bacterium]